MSILFFKLVGMSVTAGWLILAVVIARHFLGKAPKGVNYILWMLVAIRLLCPFLPESNLSLVPSGVHEVSTRQVQDSLLVRMGVNQGLLTGIWIVGVLLLLGYSLISFIRLYIHLRTAVRLKEDVWQSEYVKTPFILGICSPKIYVPYHISEQQLAMVVAHERSHAKQKDHIIKLVAFFLLAVYWFQPLVWVAYILLCRDIEIACDERVVKNMKPRERKMYSEALLSFSVSRHSIAACPVFFGEVGVKMRIKKILSYHKSSTGVRMGAAAACALLGICFLTNPKEPDMVTALSDQAEPDTLSVLSSTGKPDAAITGTAGEVQLAKASETSSSQESNASDEMSDSKEEQEVLPEKTAGNASEQKTDQSFIVEETEDGDQSGAIGAETDGADNLESGVETEDPDNLESPGESADDTEADGEEGKNVEDINKPAESESSKDQISQVGNGSPENGTEADEDSDTTEGGAGPDVSVPEADADSGMTGDTADQIQTDIPEINVEQTENVE